jgi:DNA-binding LytR/AlgR family response regulator
MTRVGDIVTIDAAANDMIVKLAMGDEVTIRGPLNRCLEKLPEFFFKAERGCAVNLQQVGRVDASKRNILLVMKNGREVRMSRTQSKLFGRRFTL